MDKTEREGKITKIRQVKPEIRVLGVDDGAFAPHTEELVDVVGVVFRGGRFLDGFMHTLIQVDGTDATSKIAEMILKSPHYPQLRVVMLNGVTMAGFNTVDIAELHERIRLPILAVTRDRPNFQDIKKALRHLPEAEKRWNAIKKAGKIMEVRTHKGDAYIYAHVSGTSRETAKRILKITSTHSNLPEPLRVAHIIASGLWQHRIAYDRRHLFGCEKV